VAVDDEQRPLETEPELAEPQRAVGWAAPVVGDDDIRRVLFQPLLHCVGDHEAARDNRRRRLLQALDHDPASRVLPAPLGIELLRDRGVGEEQAHLVPKLGEGEGEEGRRGARAARADEAEQLVGHEHDPLRLVHAARVHSPSS
jgi:hypothetical protein